uniref:Right handed beta helix domain-containing protein n=1 Tax=Tetradesmus obliquus TaxID=3088 RepID=A0A383VZA6_TETOB|eukprot:jgi/Sobl393_1/6277/SZX70785.1
MLCNLTVSGYAGGNHRGGGGVLIQRAAGGAAGDDGGVAPAGTGATLVADNVTFSHISPRAVANIDHTAAAIDLNHTSFVSNNHSGVTCYEASEGWKDFFYDNFQCYVPSDEAGAAGLTTVSNVTFSGVTRFVGNTWGALHSRGTSSQPVWMLFHGPLLLLSNNKPTTQA